MDELKPCPFCGDPDGEVSPSTCVGMDGQFKRAVYCNGCFAEGPPADTEAEAIAAWNRRSQPSAPRAEAVEAISREYHAEITQQLRGREAVLRDLLEECRYPLLVAKADAESAGEQEDLELLGALLRKINAALAAIAQGADEGERG